MGSCVQKDARRSVANSRAETDGRRKGSSPAVHAAQARRQSVIDGMAQGLGLEPVTCPNCGTVVHPRLLDCCPQLPIFAPALGGVPQLCSKCKGGRGPDRAGRPARQRLVAQPAGGWEGAPGGGGCALRGVRPAWSQCSGRGIHCDDCGGEACAACRRFVDAAARIARWMQRSNFALTAQLSPAALRQSQACLRGNVRQCLTEGLSQAIWERIDHAVERRARSGAEPRAVDWVPSASEADFPAASALQWPRQGLVQLAKERHQDAEAQYRQLLQAVSDDEQVPVDYLCGLLREGGAVLGSRRNVQHLTFAEDASKCVVVGDLHGQLRDLLYILEEHGLPCPRKTLYVFNGDFVDRGNRGCEVVALIACLVIVYRDAVFVNRGNHECLKLASAYNFRSECELKYGPGKVLDSFGRFFKEIPLCTVICNEILVVHAGPPRDPNTTLATIDALDRRLEMIPDADGQMFADLVWSDPVDTIDNWRPNINRGTGILWGPKHTGRFLRTNGLRHIIRSHEVFDTGFHWHHGRRVTTVFSASHYTGAVYRNEGAVIIVTPCQGGPARTEMHADTWRVYEDQWRERGGSFNSAPLDTAQDLRSPVAASPRLASGTTSAERKVRRELGEMVSRHRHQLLLRFTSCDRKRIGLIDACDFALCVGLITRIDAPWYFLRRSLAGEETMDGRPGAGVHYVRFLRRFGIPLENKLSADWFPYRCRWLQYRCAQKDVYYIGQKVRARFRDGKWRSGLTVTAMVGFRPAVQGRFYDFVEPLEECQRVTPEDLFDAYDSQRTGRLSYGEFQALITDGLVSPMNMAEAFLFFLEFVAFGEALGIKLPPGGDAFITKHVYSAALGAARTFPLARDVVHAIDDPVDYDENFHMWDVWLLLRFRALFRDLVRFHGDKRTAFAVFTGRASRMATIDHQGVRRAIARLRMSQIAAPERECEWMGRRSKPPPELTERFWPGVGWNEERGCYLVHVWHLVEQQSQGPPDAHVDAFIRRLSGGANKATYAHFLRAFFVHDLEHTSAEPEDSTTDEGGPDDISVACLTPTPTGGRHGASWRDTREQQYAAAQR